MICKLFIKYALMMCHTGSADDPRMTSLFSFSETLGTLGFKEMRYIVIRLPINLHSCLSPLCRVSLFNAPSNSKMTSSACYHRHELEKRRMCEKRICEVEHGSFTPIVLSSSSGWGPSATVAFRGLASLLSMKLNHHYIRTLTFLRRKVTFSLLDSAIIVSGEPGTPPTGQPMMTPACKISLWTSS